MSQADVMQAKSCMEYYRKLGLCPLPSRTDIKGPLLKSYAEHYEGKPVPRWAYEKWNTPNQQIITGMRSPTETKIVVVDLDGPEAIETWTRIAEHYGFLGSKHWASTTGSGGRHLWFRLADDVKRCPSGIIWGLWDTWGRNEIKPGRGDWCKHKEIRILADHSLVVAPPSVHVDTGIRYQFDHNASPRTFKLPALAPEWLLAMPRLAALRFSDSTVTAGRVPAAYVRKSDKHYTREEVIHAVGNDKFEIATNEWGLVAKSKFPNLSGWYSCYVPGREDPRYSRPSGSFHAKDGTLQDRKDMSSISFFDLSVVLGAYERWQDCRDALGDRYLGTRSAKLGQN